MPNLTAHLDIALEGARRLRCPAVDSHLGSFLLGCTAPDIRIITRWGRQETHFSPLDTETVGEGARLMFQQYPRLARADQLTGPTQAFMAGYISHLIADEAWIVLLYRPFFGNQGVFSDPREGKLLDRALQLELDRRAAADPEVVQATQRSLASSVDGVHVGFIPPETLLAWRDWLAEAVQRPFSWDRLRRMVWRAYASDDPEGTEVVEQFLGDVAEGLESIYRRVPREAVRRFREETVREFLRLTGEYLPCA